LLQISFFFSPDSQKLFSPIKLRRKSIPFLIVQLLRHGEAEPRAAARSDSERHLTKNGADLVRRSLAIALELGANVDSIISSPYVRARETAEIARQVFGLSKVIENSILEPTSYRTEVLRELALGNFSGDVLLVTHQPLISGLISSLLGWDEDSFAVRPGTFVRIDVKEFGSVPAGRLILFVPPPVR
jgi:phosphohistidine phosphatase